ncbi:hypothetical protein GGR56DRAFT_614006 [Xylariaceae sp. FL0804]|nr:hypothetical protein GGR56DRAFT_614006 [Xylariaceae sp. FL0804]
MRHPRTLHIMLLCTVAVRCSSAGLKSFVRRLVILGMELRTRLRTGSVQATVVAVERRHQTRSMCVSLEWWPSRKTWHFTLHLSLKRALPGHHHPTMGKAIGARIFRKVPTYLCMYLPAYLETVNC